MAFKTRYEAFEFTVTPWGLCNIPSIFQRFMNHVLGDLIDKGVIIYIDDILIYTETEEEHIQLVTKVLKLLHDAGLCIALKKSVFHAQRVEFLGYIIGVDGVTMSEEVVKKIKEWKASKNIKEVQNFLGFTTSTADSSSFIARSVRY